ncbi:MAG: PE family protein, partial [Mycobacterium sp.]
MTFLITTPDIISGAATDLANVGSTLGLANSAAAAPTTEILAAAQDEVSVQIAAMFSRYAYEFQQLSHGAAAYHANFVQALNAAAYSYASADASLAGSLAGLFNAVIYQPTYTVGQAWITSRIGEFVDDTFINPIGQALIGRDLLGNGAAGVSGGTALQAAGGPGGLLFGNGGTGGTAASGQG